MANLTDLLREEYTIDTPENVTFGYEVAGIGNRFIAALLDSLLLVLALVALNVLILVALNAVGDLDKFLASDGENSLGWFGGLLLAVYALFNFALIWGYYMLFELLWSGQTPGKRAAKIRVVRMDGSPAGLLEVVVRNLVRVIDFLPFGYGVGLVTMFLNRRARRLGDFAAGTLVVKDRGEVSLDSLTGGTGPSGLAASDGYSRSELPGIQRLDAADVELIRDVLSRHDQGRLDPALLYRVAAAMAAKLSVPVPAQHWTDSRKFLTEIAEAYRQFRQ